MKQIEVGFRSNTGLIIDPAQLEALLCEKRTQAAELDKHKKERVKLGEKLVSLQAQIAKIDECSSSMVGLIKIFRSKSTEFEEQLKTESTTNDTLRARLVETRNIIKNQALDAVSVSNLHNQMQLSRRRIAELSENCDLVKSELLFLDTEGRELNFRIEDSLLSLAKEVQKIKSDIVACDVSFDSSFLVGFGISDWKSEDSAIKFKEYMGRTKQVLNDAIKNVLSKKSQLEKENCDKNLDLMGLDDRKVEFVRKVTEVDRHYRISEQNARGMMSDAIDGTEDSILKLSNDKWSIKKTIEDNKSDIMLLESRLKTKRKLHQENNQNLTHEVDVTVSALSGTLCKSLATLNEKCKKASLMQSDLEEYLNHYS